MSKSVLISVNPKWCELIASGIKTVDVRKTRPKLETPFKCYIYCTTSKSKEERLILQPFGYKLGGIESSLTYRANGKVIGEFVCDKAERIMADGTCHPQFGYGGTRYNFGHLEDAQLSEQELYDYLGEPVILTDDPCYKKMEFSGYAWHISDLKIYDKPRELSEFRTFCKSYYDGDKCDDCKYFIDGRGYEYDESDCSCDGLKPIERPPHSWFFVEGEK